MSTSTGQARTRAALAIIFIGGVIASLIWGATQIRNLRRDQAEQSQRLQQASSAVPIVAPPPRAEPAPPPPPAPPNWADQLTEIRTEMRAEIAKLQEQVRRRDPASAEAQLTSLREENRAELTRLRDEMTASDQEAVKQSRDRQEELLKGLRDQVRVLDRRTAVLATAVRGTRAARVARSARVAARRKRLALTPVTPARARNVTVVYPSRP